MFESGSQDAPGDPSEAHADEESKDEVRPRTRQQLRSQANKTVAAVRKTTEQMSVHSDVTSTAQNSKMPQTRANTKNKKAVPLKTIAEDSRDNSSKGSGPTPKSLTLQAQGKSTQNETNTRYCSPDQN